MKILMKHVVNRNFVEAVNFLSTLSLPFKESYNISKTIQKMAEEQELFNKMVTERQAKIAKLDDEGNPVKKEDGSFELDPEKILEAEKELQEFLETNSIEVSEVDANTLMDQKITPSQINALIPILANLPEPL